jgi:hypothetical protein
MTDENQHWVPKFLIKNFTDDDGRVFCLDINTAHVTKPPPKYAASGAGFNDFAMQGEIVSFEDRLEKMETAAAPLLRKIINSRSLSVLNEAQRKKVADFIAVQSFRTEAFHQGLDPKISRKGFGQIFARMWDSAVHLSAEILRRKWALMVIDHDDIFYLGDHPIILQNMEKPLWPGELGFDIEGVEALIPLSPKCALWLPCAIKTKEIIDGYELAQKNIQEAESQKIAWEAVGLTDMLLVSIPVN